MNEIIIMNATGAANLPTFKNQKLTEAAAKIQAIYSNAAKYAETKNREVAIILSNIKNARAYEEDGFKSVADFAEKIFGIKKQNAYALATAGDVYNDSKASAALKAMSPSKVAEIATMNRETVEKAIADGTITADTTQKQLREFKTANSGGSDDDKPTVQVLPQYVARPLIGYIPEDMSHWLSIGLCLDELDKKFCEYVASATPSEGEHRAPEIIKLPKTAPYKTPNGKKHTVIRRLYVSDTASIAVEFYEYHPVTVKEEKKPESRKYSREELLAMLQALDKEIGEEE